MSRGLILEPEAEAEIAEAATWYEARNPGRGPQFLRSVESLLGAVLRNPYQYQAVFRDVRRAPLRGFPYGLMYVATE
jgi:plasmid stabilization system protein ParE